jgi:phosphoribosylglycinamide formyltransferase-1
MNIVILGSGKGSNAQAVIEAQVSQYIGNAKVSAILSDVPDSGILKVAESNGIEGFYLDPGPFRTKFDETAERVWIEKLQSLKPDLIALAGFMRILKPAFLQEFQGRIINIHPSLLPSFKGLNAIKQAFDFGVKISGCTVHWVDEGVDSGTIIAQSPVRKMHGDTLELFGQKIQAAEHMLFPAIMRDLSTGVIPFPIQ